MTMAALARARRRWRRREIARFRWPDPFFFYQVERLVGTRTAISSLNQLFTMAPLRERLSHESIVENGKLRDGAALLKAVVSIANGYAKTLLRNSQDREWLKHLARQNAANGSYHEHAEHANLSWAVDGFEKAVLSVKDVHGEELERAVRYLKLLGRSRNSFVSASAHLYLALVWLVRHNPYKVAWHILQMFNVGPRISRSEFAPTLWKQLFLPRFSKLEEWYSKETGNPSTQKVPSSGKISPRQSSYSIEALYTDLKGFWHQLHPSSARSGPLDQLCLEREEKLHVLRSLYQESLDENTKAFAGFYQYAISQHRKGGTLKFPSVKTPQIRLQYVQREFLSRSNLVAPSERNKTKAKENVCPSIGNIMESPTTPKETKKPSMSNGNELGSWRVRSGSEMDNGSPAYSTVSQSSPFSSTENSTDKKIPLAETPIKLDTSKNMEDLRKAVATLCSVENLQDCEQVVPVIARVWMESKGNPRLEAFLTKPVVIDVMMEFMVTSKSLQTQRTAVCLLTEFVHNNEAVRRRIVDYDPSLGWVSKTLQQGRIPQAVVLLYLLKLPSPELEALQLVPALVEVLQEQVVVDRTSPALRAPRAAAIFLLEQLVSFDLCAIAKVSEGAAPYLLQCLESETPEEQVSVMVILLCCMEADQTCSDFIAQHCKPSKLMQLVQSHDSRSREIAIAFVHSLLLARKKL
ncbi:hypothetical protein SELMODRAFT_424455 [Selaginella moellendorffii]|uniref:Uncharacterized protein n=2 Tax=Selaginella moellendorffii TaxID=88036 RepID=D8SPY2_SELML|nr:hypothetical protein SELMODRAFT_424455 [Selaginella moellendorffii]